MKRHREKRTKNSVLVYPRFLLVRFHDLSCVETAIMSLVVVRLKIINALADDSAEVSSKTHGHASLEEGEEVLGWDLLDRFAEICQVLQEFQRPVVEESGGFNHKRKNEDSFF